MSKQLTFGERLRQLRIEKDWSQEQLRRMAGFSDKSVISALELGREPKLSTPLKLAKALGVTVDSILGIPDEKELLKLSLANRLKHLRLRRGWSMVKLSRKTGIHPSTVSALELGRVSPEPATAVKLAVALNVTIGLLLAISDEESVLLNAGIGDRVKYLRKQKGWSQRRLSDEANLSVSSLVSQLESGKIKKPTKSTLSKLAKALGVTVEFLSAIPQEPVPLNLNIASRLKHLRKQSGLSQTELSKQSGFSTNVVSALELGGKLKLSTLLKLAEGLGVTVDSILGIPDEKELLKLSIGDRVKCMRFRRGWSIVELSRKTGIHPGTISDLEMSRIKPEPATAFKLAEALGVTKEFLLGTAIVSISNQTLFDRAI